MKNRTKEFTAAGDACAARTVSDAVATWVRDVELLLAQTQTALEALRHHDGLPPDAQHLIYRLLVLVRERRAQAPTPEAVGDWVRICGGCCAR